MISGSNSSPFSCSFSSRLGEISIEEIRLSRRGSGIGEGKTRKEDRQSIWIHLLEHWVMNEDEEKDGDDRWMFRDLLRRAAANDQLYGEEVNRYLLKGELVPMVRSSLLDLLVR